MLLTQGVHYKNSSKRLRVSSWEGEGAETYLKYGIQGGLKGPRTDSSGRLQRADCHRNTYLQLLITAWATEIYYLEWQQGSISANSSLPLEEGEQLRVNYYPSKHQSSSIPPPYPNPDHKVILQLDLKQTFHVSISLPCVFKKKKKNCTAYKTTSFYLNSQDRKCYIYFGVWNYTKLTVNLVIMYLIA